MTTHVDDPSIDGDPRRARAATDRPQTAPARPRWLLPGLAAALVAAGLVVAGVVSLSTMLYIAVFGGMLLMHLGGHGHGGHGGGGHSEHGAQGGGEMSDDHDLSRRSDGSQPLRSASGDELDDRASNQSRNETEVALPTGQVVPVEFMPGQPGAHEFTCKMGMLRGQIVMEAA